MAGAPVPPLYQSPLVVRAPAERKRLSLSTKACTHALKLRTSVKLSSQARLELGADLHLSADSGGASVGGAGALTPDQPLFHLAPAHWTHLPALEFRSAAPWAALMFQLDPQDRSQGCIKLDPHKLCAHRRLRLGRKDAWSEVPLDLCLGVRLSDGGLLMDVRPAKWPMELALGAALLAAGKKVHLHKEFGTGLMLRFPIRGGTGGAKPHHTLQERAEVSACLQRQGRGLSLDVRQLNGVVCLRES